MAEIWHKRAGESIKAYAAFTAYCSLSKTATHPEEKRNAKTVAKITNTPLSTINRWMSDYDWVRRANDYDAKRMDLVQTRTVDSLVAYQSAVIAKEGYLLSAATQMIESVMMKMQDSEEYSPKDALVLLQAIDKWSLIARRSARLPTQFQTVMADEQPEDTVFEVPRMTETEAQDVNAPYEENEPDSETGSELSEAGMGG